MTDTRKQHLRIFFSACFSAIIIAACHPANTVTENRLSKASSPYLREHADNPVDWYEWSDEALAKAEKEHKPLLISIGYAACHWCHEMEKESFMDTAVARMMNENFICIKVDREQRPDIDNLYVHACQLLNNGQAGWPLNAFALPDGKPFFAGTYYSKENWLKLLEQISGTFKNRYNKVLMQANSLTFGIIDNDSLLIKNPGSNPQTGSAYKASFENMFSKVDIQHGGLKGAPKFPVPGVWEFMLQYAYFSGDKHALDAVNTTLTKMAVSSLYDQAGGGFARYATDSLWRVPHFEKMLYDNAQLTSLYAHAYQYTRNDFFKQVSLETFAFAERELSAGNGGFYCSLNADTEAGEGAYYTWKANEIRNLAPAEFNWLAKYYHLPVEEAAADKENILYADAEPAAFAAANNVPAATFAANLQRTKTILLAERNKRPRPTVDDKILAGWNALMLKASTDAYAAFGEPRLLQSALKTADFLEKNMMGPDGRLYRSYANGKAREEAFLDDYSLLAQAYIRLYQTSFDIHWLQLAQKLTDYAVANFYDASSGYFFFTSAAAEKLPLRKMELLNNVMPASNAVMAENLFYLGVLFQSKDYQEKCRRMVAGIEGKLSTMATSAPAWALVSGLLSQPINEVAIMGNDAISMSLVLQKEYLPGAVFMGGVRENLPLLESKMPASGTLIYVCTNQTCQRPVSLASAALEQLKAKSW